MSNLKYYLVLLVCLAYSSHTVSSLACYECMNCPQKVKENHFYSNCSEETDSCYMINNLYRQEKKRSQTSNYASYYYVNYYYIERGCIAKEACNPSGTVKCCDTDFCNFSSISSTTKPALFFIFSSFFFSSYLFN